MSKNITIAEGSQAKNFNTVHKLRTNLIGGGTQYWVPEDEAGAYAKMGQKSITANGTYRASDDSKDGYSQVTVNVQPRVTSKSINENGRYYANSDGYDGYSSVEVNVSGGGGTLITKNIEANGTYKALDDGANGYSEVTVNVNEVVGVDSNDGNEYAVDRDPTTGVLQKKVLPSEIRITTLPSRINYVEGQTIDLTGAIVKAYKKDGTIWSDEGYSSGIIPISELHPLPSKASYASNDKLVRTSVLDYSFICSSPGAYLHVTLIIGEKSSWTDVFELGYSYAAVFNDGYNLWAILANGEPFTAIRTRHRTGEEEGTSTQCASHPVTINGQQAHVYVMHYMGGTGQSLSSNYPENITVPSQLDTDTVGWAMVYGEGVGAQKIIVRWGRPKDHKLLTDNFYIQGY